MSGPLLGLAGIAAMLLMLFFLRLPAAFVLLVVGFFGFATATSFDAAATMLGSEIWSSFSNYGLTVIPLFILVGRSSITPVTTTASISPPISGSGIAGGDWR